MFHATCVATPLRDKLQRPLPRAYPAPSVPLFSLIAIRISSISEQGMVPSLKRNPRGVSLPTPMLRNFNGAQSSIRFATKLVEWLSK
jgi:hypothetical protein